MEPNDAKREENYKYAKRIGLFILLFYVVTGLYSYFTESEVNMPRLLVIVPFAVELFYPYPKEWAFLKKLWKWFWESLWRSFYYFVITAFLTVAAFAVSILIDQYF